MYVILFITHQRYHSLTHIKTTAIEIQDIKNIKKNEPGEKNIQYNKTTGVSGEYYINNT
jgi:hypothetical protein